MNPPASAHTSLTEMVHFDGPEELITEATPLKLLKEDWTRLLAEEEAIYYNFPRVHQLLHTNKELYPKTYEAKGDDPIKEFKIPPRVEWWSALDHEIKRLHHLDRNQEIDRRLSSPISIEKLNTIQHSGIYVPLKVGFDSLLTARQPFIRLMELLEPDPDWASNLPKYYHNYGDELRHMYRENIGTDICVVIGNTKFHCHRMPLMALSRYFYERKNFSVLHLPECRVTAKEFVAAYRWFIEPIKSVTHTQIVDLLRAAKFMGINRLICQCLRIMFKSLRCHDRSLAVYAISKRAAAAVERIIMPYVRHLWLPFAASREFADLDLSKLCYFFRMNNMAVNSEMEVFYTAILWLDYDWPKRKDQSYKLMRSIHFEMMPYAFLGTFGIMDGPPALRHVAACPKIYKLVRRALRYLKKIPQKQNGDKGQFSKHWIYDPSCTYHHGLNCNNIRYVTYGEFSKYIQWVQECGYPYCFRLRPYAARDIVCCES